MVRDSILDQPIPLKVMDAERNYKSCDRITNTRRAYLKNELCHFEILSDYDQTKKYNILTACFFKMNAHYKNFKTYLNGIRELIGMLNRQTKFVLRLFIDEHIRNDTAIYSQLSKHKKVQLVLFRCTDYIANQYHIDVFGAMVRLFPFFNFENNDALDVIAVDIDLNPPDLMRLSLLMTIKTDKKEIISSGSVSGLVELGQQPHLFCNSFGVFNHVFDKKIMIQFIKSASQINDKGFYNKRLSMFGYGTDELFLNEYFVFKPPYTQINTLSVGITMMYDINWFIFYSKNELLKTKYKQTFNCLKFIVGKYYKSTMSVEDLFKFIDRGTYMVNSKNEKKVYLTTRFYILIDLLVTQNKEWIDMQYLLLIYRCLHGVVDCLAKAIYDVRKNKITDIIIIKKNIWD